VHGNMQFYHSTRMTKVISITLELLWIVSEKKTKTAELLPN